MKSIVIAAWLLLSISGPLAAQEATPVSGWWHPAPGLSWQIQYAGVIDTSLDVDLYNLDLFDTSQETIAQLHQEGRKAICSFSAGSWEEWRPDADRFIAADNGNSYDGWEY